MQHPAVHVRLQSEGTVVTTVCVCVVRRVYSLVDKGTVVTTVCVCVVRSRVLVVLIKIPSLR